MLWHFYNLIREKFDLSTVDVAFNVANNCLEIYVFSSLQFNIYFYENSFKVGMAEENGIISYIIGGRTIHEVTSEEAVIATIEHIVDYSRLRIGAKYFDVGDYQ